MAISKLHLCLLVLVIAGFVWSVIHPVDFTTWVLEIIPVVVVLPLLAFTYQSFRLTNLLYSLIAVHALILMVGAHYTYAHVPLFDTIKDMVGNGRNSYDGVGHFAQGFIPAMAAREILLRKSGIHSGFLLSLSIVLACFGISAIYEVIEWVVAVWMGQGANEFLGTQGDVWDTQKDMALAGFGATCSILFLSKIHDGQLSRLGRE